jgi:hypothetical protein
LKRTIVGIVCFYTIASGIAPVTIAQTPSQDENLARFLLEEIRGARQKIRDVKHTAVYHDYKSPKSFQLSVERLALQLKEKYPEEHAEDTIRRLKANYSKHRFSRLDMAIDSEGRARIETNFGPASEKGILVAADSTRKVVTWDGENAIKYVEDSKNLKSATLSNERPSQTTKSSRRPWRQFGGNFYDRLSRTIAESTRVDIERTEDGLYRITISRGDDGREIGTFDPSQGYSLIRTEYHSGQHLVGFNEATFMEVSPDIWFPVEGEVVWFFENGPPEVARKTSMKVSDIVVNDPNFYDGLFHVDFPEGTTVVDRNTGLRYVVGEPMSETPEN